MAILTGTNLLGSALAPLYLSRISYKLTEREGRLLKRLSSTMMLELGVLLVAPQWLNISRFNDAHIACLE